MLRAALELVRGEPFIAIPTGTYHWAESPCDHLAQQIRVAVTNAADDLAQLAREALHDLGLERWASGRRLVEDEVSLT